MAEHLFSWTGLDNLSTFHEHDIIRRAPYLLDGMGNQNDLRLMINPVLRREWGSIHRRFEPHSK